MLQNSTADSRCGRERRGTPDFVAPRPAARRPGAAALAPPPGARRPPPRPGAAAWRGTVFYFGVPDDDCYPVSMRHMLRSNLTLISGITLERRRMLAAADDFAREHPDLLPAYVTHTFGVDEVQQAFELAARPTPGRIKIVLVP